MKKIIVKIQTSLNSGTSNFLVYNESRTVKYEGPITPEVRSLMGERVKAFCFAEVTNGKLSLGDLTADQTW
ncbi:MAG: hypothetical protein EOP06_05255 [Proteobacteria bacterium]|nr:MAG: hypothetical protein EOP06_05255 [Pseudomonadota bacterium]